MFKKRLFQNLIYPIVKKILHSSAKYYSLKKNYDQFIVYSFDAVSTEINLNGIYEKELLFFLKAYLKQNNFNLEKKTAIDIGAFIGNHSIFFSRMFENVISFEPHPTSFEILKLNCKNSGNIKLYNFGCSNKNENSFLRLKHTNIGGSNISNGKHERDFSIKLIKLDDLLKDYDHEIGLIKIDTEGHEENVINGSVELLKKNKPIIVMELKNFNNYEEPNVIKKLRTIGYSNFFELEKKVKFDKLNNNLLFSILDKIFNLFFENSIEMKEIKNFEKKEYQNLIIT